MALKKETKKAPAPKKVTPSKKAVAKKIVTPKISVTPEKVSGPDWDLVKDTISSADRTLSPSDVEDILLVIKEGEQATANSRWYWVWDSVKSLL